MVKTSQGGKREGSGRKPVDDPKIQLSIYPQKSEIEVFDNMEEAKKVALECFKKEAKKRKNQVNK